MGLRKPDATRTFYAFGKSVMASGVAAATALAVVLARVDNTGVFIMAVLELLLPLLCKWMVSVR